MISKLFEPHSIIVTIMILVVIWLMNIIRLNLHFIDPFNYSLKEYETTDIVYSQLQSDKVQSEQQIILVNTERPSRTKLAQLIDHIIATEPKSIGIDILLEGRKEWKEDSLLQASLKKTDKLVLGVALNKYIDSLELFESVDRCDTFFSDYSYTGYVNFPSNETRTIRYFSPKEKTLEGEKLAFATQIASLYDEESVVALLERGKELEQINYIGNTLSFAHYPDREELLSISPEDLKPAFKDRIVLMGYFGEKELDDSLLDKFFTPLNSRYTGRSTPDMYGLFIHANIISMIINGKYIYVVPIWISNLIGILFCYMNVIIMRNIYRRFHEAFHGIARLIQMAEFLLIFLLSALLFYFFKIKLEFTIGLLALVLAYDIVMIYESLIRKRLPFLARLNLKK